MKKLILLSIASMLLIVGNINARISLPSHNKKANDSLSYTTLTAKIVRSDNKRPGCFCFDSR
jgi:hypothetical protein